MDNNVLHTRMGNYNMKFEIDDKTGFLLIEPENGIIPSNDNAKIYREQLERILQAVKKTQEKLVNQQIQEIQTEKANGLLWFDDVYKQLKYKQDGKTTILNLDEKIEQNQKIIDEIIKFYNSQKDNVIDLDGMNFLGSIIKNATGKDIPDL